jgi:hypothetical protein
MKNPRIELTCKIADYNGRVVETGETLRGRLRIYT